MPTSQKGMYFNDLFTEIKTTKTFWNLLRKATAPKQKNCRRYPEKQSRHLVVKDDDKACLMNTYFALVDEKLALDLSPSITRLQTPDQRSPADESVNFSEVGVLRQLKHFKSNLATAPNDISRKFLKLASHAVSRHLRSLLRQSIYHETVYESFKLARVSLIFKKDDGTDPGNYRLISTLFVPSKLLESEINAAIVNLVTNSNLITPYQWAYRQAHTTELLLIHLTRK